MAAALLGTDLPMALRLGARQSEGRGPGGGESWVGRPSLSEGAGMAMTGMSESRGSSWERKRDASFSAPLVPTPGNILTKRWKASSSRGLTMSLR